LLPNSDPNYQENIDQCRDAEGEQHWEQGACEADPACISCEPEVRDPAESNTLRFANAGRIRAFSMNDMTGQLIITIKRGAQLVATLHGAPSNQAYAIPEMFMVTAGDELTVSVEVSGEGGPSYGWRNMKAMNTCGPTNNLCGVNKDVTPVRAMAVPLINMVGITTPTNVPANEQCWGDREIEDITQDYDFNDFSIHFGYDYSYNPRPDYCVSETINKATVLPGESVRLSSVSNTDVTGFYYYAYNLDNMRDPNDPNPHDPYPICVGNDNPGYPIESCPNGGHHMVFQDPNNTLKKTGFMNTNYDALFVAVDRNSGAVPTRIQFNAYFSLNGQDWSLPKAACIKNVSAGTTTPSPTPTTSPTPSTTPSSTPTATPTDAPMCVKAAMFKQGPNGGAWAEVPEADYDTLKIGDVVRFGVNGSSPSFTKGRFKINGGVWIESSTKMTVGGKSYFYINHTLASGNYEVVSEIQ